MECDEVSLSRLNMNEARVCVRTSCNDLINEDIVTSIDGNTFTIYLCEVPSQFFVNAERKFHRDDVNSDSLKSEDF